MNLFSFMAKKPDPEWIDDITYEGDKETVRALVKAGAKLEEPREIVFCVYTTEAAAPRIVDDLTMQGWTVQSTPTADADTDALSQYIEIKKEPYAIVAKDFEQDKQTIQTVAQKYGGEYDGWYASV